MEYLSPTDHAFTIRLSCTATHPTSIRAERIVDNVLSKSETITTKTKTNRQMWPDTETVGVEFEQNDPYLEGSITRGEVELQFHVADGFEQAYETVAAWCDDATFTLPEPEEFLVEIATITLDEDGRGVLLDQTKCGEHTLFGGYTYSAAGVDGAYDAYNGWVSAFFDDEQASPDAVLEHLDEFLSEDYVVIAENEEITSDFGPEDL